MTYRCQFRDHLGVVATAFGGRVVHRTPWKTAVKLPDQESAVAYCQRRTHYGLRQWRVVLGKQLIQQWL